MTLMCKVCGLPVYAHTDKESIECLKAINTDYQNIQGTPNQKLRKAMKDR